jgi:hypothetical protein
MQEAQQHETLLINLIYAWEWAHKETTRSTKDDQLDTAFVRTVNVIGWKAEIAAISG